MAERFLPRLLSATLAMGALVAGLVWVGRRAPERPQGSLDAPAAARPAGPRSTLDLVPARSWLVLDFDGDLVDTRPFADDGPPCDGVRAPARVVFAAAPDPSGELSFWLGAAPASEAFVACARRKILAAGGRVAPSHPEWTVLEAPSGVFVTRGDAVLFSTSGADRAELEGLLTATTPSAERAGPHGAALRRWATGTPLALSLELPDGWLRQVDAEAADASPLRALRGASLAIEPNGGARGVVRCEASGCAALERFAERAWAELTTQLPASSAAALRSAVTLRPPAAGASEFELAIGREGVELARRLLTGWGRAHPLP